LQVQVIKLNGDGSKAMRVTLAMKGPMRLQTKELIKPLAGLNSEQLTKERLQFVKLV
jgi:hypothetical protein